METTASRPPAHGGTATLSETPRVVGGVRLARATLAPDDLPILVRFREGGDLHPYSAGDVVEVSIPHGDMAGGVYCLGRIGGAVTPEGAGNRELHARDSGSIVLRAREGYVDAVQGDGERQVVMLHDRAARELAALRLYVALLNVAIDGITGGAGTTALDTALKAFGLTLADGFGGVAALNLRAEGGAEPPPFGIPEAP